MSGAAPSSSSLRERVERIPDDYLVCDGFSIYREVTKSRALGRLAVELESPFVRPYAPVAARKSTWGTARLEVASNASLREHAQALSIDYEQISRTPLKRAMRRLLHQVPAVYEPVTGVMIGGGSAVRMFGWGRPPARARRRLPEGSYMSAQLRSFIVVGAVTLGGEELRDQQQSAHASLAGAAISGEPHSMELPGVVVARVPLANKPRIMAEAHAEAAVLARQATIPLSLGPIHFRQELPTSNVQIRY